MNISWKIIQVYLSCCTIFLCFSSIQAQETMNFEYVIDQIKKRKESYEQEKGKDVQFISVFDYDGTIFNGDITDGLPGSYQGLAYESILQDFIPAYIGKEGNQAFRHTYELLHAEKHFGTTMAYDFMAMVFSSSHRPQEYEQFIKEYFHQILRPYHFKFMMDLIVFLRQESVENFVISASPHCFVQAASQVVPIPKEHLWGINGAYEKGKRVDPLIHFAQGKIERLKKIIKDLEKKNKKKVIVLGGFGNSWRSDGPFIRYIMKEFGGLGVMINTPNIPTDFATDPYYSKMLQINLKENYDFSQKTGQF